MNRLLMFGLFFVVFSSVYGLLNYYVFARFSKLFGLARTPWFFAAVVFCTLSFLVASLLESWTRNAATRVLYIVSASWMGVVFILACLLAVYELVKYLLPLDARTYGVILLGLGIVLVLIAFVSGSTLRVKEIALESPKLTQSVRLVQVSDVHLGLVRGDAHVAEIVEKIRGLDPDAVVITGDLFDGPGVYDVRTLQRFDSLGKPVFFVTGNHETYAGLEMVRLLLANTSMRWLRGESVQFKGLTIIGIDDNDDRRAVATTLKKIPRDEKNYTVLLYHRPGASALVTSVDLLLAGHTHAGQIFPFTLLGMLVESPVRGLHDVNGFKVFVSAGAGTWGPPMRLGSTNEITLVTLTPRQAPIVVETS